MNLKEVGTKKKGRGLVVEEEEEEEEEEMRKEEGVVQEQLLQAIASITLLLCFASIQLNNDQTPKPKFTATIRYLIPMPLHSLLLNLILTVSFFFYIFW